MTTRLPSSTWHALPPGQVVTIDIIVCLTVSFTTRIGEAKRRLSEQTSTDPDRWPFLVGWKTPMGWLASARLSTSSIPSSRQGRVAVHPFLWSTASASQQTVLGASLKPILPSYRLNVFDAIFSNLSLPSFWRVRLGDRRAAFKSRIL